MEFQTPRIVHEEADEHRGVFEIEPLDPRADLDELVEVVERRHPVAVRRLEVP